MLSGPIEPDLVSQVADYCRNNGIRSLRLFGSRLHGTATASSDIDLLADLDPDRNWGLFDLSRMQLELSDLLGREVDLRTPAELSRHFRSHVLQEASVIYGG